MEGPHGTFFCLPPPPCSFLSFSPGLLSAIKDVERRNRNRTGPNRRNVNESDRRRDRCSVGEMECDFKLQRPRKRSCVVTSTSTARHNLRSREGGGGDGGAGVHVVWSYLGCSVPMLRSQTSSYYKRINNWFPGAPGVRCVAADVPSTHTHTHTDILCGQDRPSEKASGPSPIDQ